MKELLDSLSEFYANDPYKREKTYTTLYTIDAIKQSSPATDSYLELGIGDSLILPALVAMFERVHVVEGSANLIAQHVNRFSQVAFVHSLFEEYDPRTQFSNVGMNFVLEHVTDPLMLLTRYAGFLAPKGKIFVSVPNAASLHRLVGHRAGILKDIGEMSDIDRRLGHKRFWSYGQWMELFAAAKLKVVSSAGLYLKPLTTQQLESLQLPENIVHGFCKLGLEWPQISNSCFFELSR